MRLFPGAAFLPTAFPSREISVILTSKEECEMKTNSLGSSVRGIAALNATPTRFPLRGLGEEKRKAIAWVNCFDHKRHFSILENLCQPSEFRGMIEIP